MKWLMVIFLVSPADDIASKPQSFESREACVAVAQAFVESNPAFELRVRGADSLEVEHPVIRSYVECAPQPAAE